MKLSKAQVKALKFLSDKTDWTNKTPVTQKCLNVLHKKGLVKVCYDMGGLGWAEKITPLGEAEVKRFLSRQ